MAVLAARTAVALEASLTQFVAAADHNLGHLEVQAAHDVQELLRQATQRAPQVKAAATPLRCPVCGQPLTRCSNGHGGSFQTRFGEITVHRTRGYCKRCRKWRTPADTALGLEDTAGYSPAVQAMAALAASKIPIADASLVLELPTRVKLPRATLDRETRRQGQRAQRLRTAPDQSAATQPPQLELTLEPYQMILQLDACNLQERDGWGQSAALRRPRPGARTLALGLRGKVILLDHRGQTAGGRPVITQRGFVLTRQGWTTCASNSTPRRCVGAWTRRPACW
jgi:hypothetical protein